jgi:hypothetical protein
MWSVQTFWLAISAEPTAGTERGALVYVQETLEASSSASGASTTSCVLLAGSFGGVAVIEFVRDAESICAGAFFRSADLIPSCVRSVTVSLWLGGVTALGAIFVLCMKEWSSSYQLG